MADFLHHEIASEPTGGLDDDRPHAVALNGLEHGGEAPPYPPRSIFWTAVAV
jgi:hypothetical protein